MLNFLNPLSSFLNSWYWYLVLPLLLLAVLQFFPVVRKLLEPALEKLGDFLGWLLQELGITVKVGLPDILNPIRTLIFVLLLCAGSFVGGMVYSHVKADDCPAVSQDIRKRFKLIPREPTSTTEKVKNWFGF